MATPKKAQRARVKEHWWEPIKTYRKEVRDYYLTHIGCTRQECAEALGINVQTVKRHVMHMRKEWGAPLLRTNTNIEEHNEARKARAMQGERDAA